MDNRIICFVILVVFTLTSYAQSSKPIEVINRFYQGWKTLSVMNDHTTGDAHNIECNINECTQGGDDCESKSLVSVPREIDFLTGNSVKGSITIGPYINDFEKFVKDNNAHFSFTQPHEIASIKGADETPVYRCYTVSKTYSWGNAHSQRLTDTIWIKTNINRISGIRNEYGGSRQVSSNNLSSPSEINTFSVTDLEIQASTFYDKGDFEGALKLYRQISLKDWSNTDANFYSMLMEAKGKGCRSLSKKYYQREAAWWYIKNARNEYYTNSLKAYILDVSFLKFKDLGMPYLSESISATYIYSTMKPLSCGLMVACDNKNKYGFINENGKNIVDYVYDKAYTYDDNGLALVRRNGKCGYINTVGKIVIPIEYEDAQPFFYKERTYCIDAGVLKLINSKGDVIKTFNTSKKYNIVEYFRTKEYAMLHYTNDILKRNFWDIYDYNGNLIHEGCDKMDIHVSQGDIVFLKDKKQIITLNYKW